MVFTIPSNDLAQNASIQSVWYDTDLAIIAAGVNGVGVVSGCTVTAQGSPDMTVAVAAGVVQNADGSTATVSGGNVTVTAASGSNPRIDLVSATAAGVKTMTNGTAAASPKPPALPAGNIALAMVYVGTSDTAIQTAEITDKRFIVARVVGVGTSFPAAKSTGDRYFRSDLGMEFYWNATSWVTTQLFSAIGNGGSFYVVSGTTLVTPISANMIGMRFALQQFGLNAWLEEIRGVTFTAATNDGTKFWTFALKKNSDNSTIASFSTAADTAAVATAHSSTISASSTEGVVYMDATKTSTPGNCTITVMLLYRLIAT